MHRSPQLPLAGSVDVGALSRLFGSTTNSYKLLFFAALLERLREKPDAAMVDLRWLAARMLAKAHHPITVFHLSFGSQDRVAQLLARADAPGAAVTPEGRRRLHRQFEFHSERPLYRIDRKAGVLEIHPAWQAYLLRHLAILEGWASFHFVRFVQDRNPSVPAIPTRLPRERLTSRRLLTSAYAEVIPALLTQAGRLGFEGGWRYAGR